MTLTPVDKHISELYEEEYKVNFVCSYGPHGSLIQMTNINVDLSVAIDYKDFQSDEYVIKILDVMKQAVKTIKEEIENDSSRS